MTDTDNHILPEDYEEPNCPFCMQDPKGPIVTRIPVARVREKLDEYLSHNDYPSAEKHLLYWLEEAKSGNDDRGQFFLHNELMGLYRKLGKKEQAMNQADAAVKLADSLGILSEVSGATALLNAGTVRKAFGMPQEALPFFEKAKAIYASQLPANDYRQAGLLNNMALTLTDLGRFEEARGNYQKALAILKTIKDTEGEQAVTWLNLADLEVLQYGAEASEAAVCEDVELAYALITTDSIPQNGDYAFYCEKCAPAFGSHGFFLYQLELEERAKKIYERN